jgi:uncharacterized protein YggE
MRRLRWLLPLAALLLAASAIAGVAQPHLGRAADTTPAPRTITVTGNGKVTVVPDRAAFGFSAQTRADTAQAALAKNAALANAIVAALENAGIAAADIQTQQVSLDPQLNQSGTDVIGYNASTTVSVQTTIAKAGAIVDAAVGAGANGVSGPSLSRSDQDAQYREALKQAVADAKDKAQALAAAGGLNLGAVRAIVEGSGVVPVPLAMGKAADSAGVAIEPGTQDIDATVTVTYDAG